MLNQFWIVGEVEELKKENKDYTNITLKVPNKNKLNSNYIINFLVSNTIINSLSKKIKINNIIVIRGYIETTDNNNTNLIAEEIKFVQL